ncbi:MAG TPA: ATP-binding protein [Thermoanaerobaculia bacterium]
MNYDRKGRSPFYPGQPVRYELFVGRAAEVERIRRATYQVAAGKPQAIFIAGEYGIGKSSLASFMLSAAELDPQLLGFHVLLGTAASLEGVAQATVRTVMDKLRMAADISSGYLPFLRSIHEQCKDQRQGLMLILDEINGLASQRPFSGFLKDLVDSNAISRQPLPLLLIVCGTDERRLLPKLMHLLGEAAYSIVPDGVVDLRSAREAIRAAMATTELPSEQGAGQVNSA